MSCSFTQVRVIGVKDGKIDVTQLSVEDEEAEEAAKGGVSTTSKAITDAGNMFQFALARAGVNSRAFETDVSLLCICLLNTFWQPIRLPCCCPALFIST